MGNAPEALKAAAKYVTGRIGEAGVAQVIERFVIGKEEPTLRA
jgi:hydroxymethylpyrimidine pyrophosphatase-like HAD family hydrolase